MFIHSMFISYAIVLHSVVPVRSEPSEGAEQETQLLFGETCQIIEEQPRWYKIRNDYDGQEGWVDFKMITKMSEEEYNQYRSSDLTAMVKMPMAFAVCTKNNLTYPLTAGTRLSNYNDGKFSLLGLEFLIDPNMVAPQPLEMTEENILQVTRYFLNIPYLWGGKNCMGLDCSGFTGIILSLFGKQLLRNAREQVLQGTEVGFLSEAQCGDLVFFDHHSRDPKQTNISHVGMLLSPDLVVHCSGRVKIEKIDANGIYSDELQSYTHDLRAIRRY